MSVKEAQALVIPQESSCPRCGHPRVESMSQPWGTRRLWLVYCPACHEVQERATIPESFLQGLPPSPPRTDLH